MRGAGAGSLWTRICLASLVAGCAAPSAAPAPEAGLVEAVETVEPPWHARGCGDCHAAQRDAWLRSAHARAWTGALFQAEWGPRHDPFCVPCHAPRATDPDEDPEAAARGVSCEACHLVDSVVRATAVSGEAPHPSRADATLRTVAACEGCHQVDFPHAPGVGLQDTVREWRAAGEIGGACQTCHMPDGDHAFPGGHDPAMLASALDVVVQAEREGLDTVVRFTLRATGAGHAVPTGDIFRRLVVRAWREGDEARALERELGRHMGHPLWREVRDDRVPAPGGGERVVELRLLGRDRPVRWTIAMASGSSHDPRRLEGVTHTPRPVASGVAQVDERPTPLR